MATTINDVFYATDVISMYNAARDYAMDNFGVSLGNSRQWIADNLPEVQRIKNLRDAGEVDYYGNYVNVPNYSFITSSENPMGAVNTSHPSTYVNVSIKGDSGNFIGQLEQDPLNPITAEGILSDPTKYAGIFQETAESDAGQSVNTVPSTEEVLPITLPVSDSEVFASSVLGDIRSSIPTSDGFSNLMTPVIESGLFDTSGDTGGVNFMPTNLTGQFYGINPTTNNVELMQNMEQNPMFRSGVAGFTDTLPTGFEFGVPFRFGNLPQFNPQTFEEFVAQKEAAELAKLQNTSNNPRSFKTSTHG
tara:strand:- start:655 stop:1569 length:915 start_codon:yes stop_codon:yes gene_type:complete